MCKYGCVHPVGGCTGLRKYSKVSLRWDSLCTQCDKTKSTHRRQILSKKNAVLPLATPVCALPACSLSGYVGVDSKELAFIPRLLAAVKTDPVLMASWASEKDYLFSEFFLLKCRRLTKSDSLDKNVKRLRAYLRARVEFNLCAVRDDILMHDRAINELPMYKEWHEEGSLVPISVCNSNKTIVSLLGRLPPGSQSLFAMVDTDAYMKFIMPYLVQAALLVITLNRRTRSIYRSTCPKVNVPPLSRRK